MSADYALGQRVRFTTYLVRGYKSGSSWMDPATKFWTPEDRLGKPNPGGEGVIVGRRTLADGTVRYLGEDGTTFTPSRHYTAWLVAFDLRRKPVHVLPEHLTALPAQHQLGEQ